MFLNPALDFTIITRVPHVWQGLTREKADFLLMRVGKQFYLVMRWECECRKTDTNTCTSEGEAADFFSMQRDQSIWGLEKGKYIFVHM